MPILNLLTESRVDLLKKRYPNLTDLDVANIMATDPTDSKKYILWLGSEYNPDWSVSKINDLLKNWEININRLNYDMLADFNIHQGFDQGTEPTPTTYKDINTYTLPDVFKLVNYITALPTKSQLRDIVRQNTIKIFEGVLDGYNVLIVRPMSYLSSCHYGSTTRWCTASKTTDHNYNRYTNTGELYYVIFKDSEYENKESGKSIFKYALYFEGDYNNPQIFNEQDSRVDTNMFFNEFPGIRSIFKDKLPLTSYEILEMLLGKKYKNDVHIGILINRLNAIDENGNIAIDDKVDLIKSGKLELDLDNDFILRTFVHEDDIGVVSHAVFGGHYEDNYTQDSYQSAQDFDDGYVFGYFNNTAWQDLMDYFELINRNTYNLVKKILKSKKRHTLYDQLVKIFNEPINERLRDEIIDEYGNAEQIAINVVGDQEIKSQLEDIVLSFFKSICKNEIVIKGFDCVIVSIEDVVSWYQNGQDAVLSEDSPQALKSISQVVKLLNKDKNFYIYDAYEAYYNGGHDQETFDEHFDVSYIIRKYTDEIELDPEILEKYEEMEKDIELLDIIGIKSNKTYNTPDGKYSLIIIDNDFNTGTFLVQIRNLETNKTDRAYLTAERIANLLNIIPTLDLIDEVYQIFSKIV